MFDVNADDGSVRKKPYRSPIPADKPNAKAKGRSGLSKLDSPDADQLWRRLIDLYTRELDRQHDNRVEMASDEDFYDNKQWDEEDAQAVKDRGQIPLVYNVVSSSVDWVTGTEKRARTDFKVLPRRKESAKPAERKTQLLKYLSDVNREPFSISRAFEECVKVGIGWIEDGWQGDDEGEPLYTRCETWRNMLWDSAAFELDIEDARYVFRSKWVDIDVAKSIFKNRKGTLDSAAADSDDFVALDEYGDLAMDSHEYALQNAGESMTSDRIQGYQRRRVRIIEAWIKLPVETTKLRGGMFSGDIYDEKSPAHREAVANGESETNKKTAMRVHVAIFCSAGMLWLSESPYRHNRFPFTPIWGHRRGRDGMPYGLIRRLKDIQVDVNKRASKALHILSTSKIIMDEDALPEDTTIEEFIEEASRPDAVLLKRAGKELTIDADRDLSQWHLELMSRSISMVQQASGVTDELLGRRTNATSGIAIQRRQDQGSLATAKFFDNLLFAQQVHGEKLLANIEQFVSEQKAFRITNMRGNPEFVVANDGLPENDIIRDKADFVISETAWHATMRQAAADELLDATSKMGPQVSLLILDLIVENMDLPNRDEIVKRIRQLNHQSDPDADPNSPEEQQRMAAQEQAQQQAQAAAMAEIRKKLADALRSEAAAKESEAKVSMTQSEIVSNNVNSEMTALQAAITAIMQPDSIDVADHILHESGFVSQSQKDEAIQALASRIAAARNAQPAPSAGAPQQQALQPPANQSAPQSQPGTPPGLGVMQQAA